MSERLRSRPRRGKPDIVDLGAAARSWANRGGARFDLPPTVREVPPVDLGDSGVQLLDADSDGRADLIVAGAVAGYFPMSFGGGWSRRGFRPCRQLPGLALADPSVRLVHLDGEGLTDVCARCQPGRRIPSWSDQ